MNELIEFIVPLAKAAGEVQKRYFGKQLTRKIKSHAEDYATEADVESEKVIMAAIHERYSDDGFFAEESGEQLGKNNVVWIIDPLDGTRNFANNITVCGPMIARAEGDTLTHAVVYNPFTEQIAYGAKGAGVYMNGEKVYAPFKKLTTLLPLAGGEQLEALFYEKGIALTHPGPSIQRAFLGLSGQNNASLSPRGKPWDVAPVALLLSEAGFKVTNFHGNPYIWREEENGILAADPKWHAQLLSYLT